MRILFVSNFYPPYHRGGYGMLCQEVATHLLDRGHEVNILTSTHGTGDDDVEPGLHRRLALESDLEYYRPQQTLRYWGDTQANRRAVEELMAEFAPDAVVVWGMWSLSRQVAAWFEELAGSRVVYYLADVWPMMPSAHEAYWDYAAGDSLIGRGFKGVFRLPVRLLLHREWRPFRLRFQHVAVCSQAVLDELVQAGIPLKDAKVIYHGIDPLPYQQAAKQRAPMQKNGTLRIVYVGALLPHKGVHTAIEALGHLAHGETPQKARLTVLGSGHPQYEERLRGLVERLQLQNSVSFHPPIPRAELPAFLARFDVLVMPSVYEEPQARISQEAMATGLVLVATLTGGTKEILVDGMNGLSFTPEDAKGLAGQLERLRKDSELRHKLASAGRQTVVDRFTVTRMIDEFESFVAEAVAGAHERADGCTQETETT